MGDSNLPAAPTRPQRVQLRVDLVGAEPPIWRSLSLPGDLTLDQVHDALQAAFGWTNSHLHRFTVDDDRYAERSDGILTQYDLDEGEEGVPETSVRLSQLVHAVGATFYYTYDFGDDWEHRILVESIEPLDEGDRSVTCVAGDGAAPTDNAGGIHWYQHLLEVAADPAHPERMDLYDQLAALRDARFDLDVINRALARLAGASESLGWLLERQSPLAAIATDLGEDARLHLAGYVTAAQLTDPVLADPIEVSSEEATRATTVVRTLLEHVGAGVKLTSAGYLPPKLVGALAGELGLDRFVTGATARESDVWRVWSLRETCVGLGLLRKNRGELLPTRLGTQLLSSPVELWHHIAGRLPLERGEHEREIGTLLLLLVAAGESQPRPHLKDSLDELTAMIGLHLVDRGPYVRTRALDVVARTDDLLSWVATGDLREYAFGQPGRRTTSATLMARVALHRQ